MPVLKDEKGNNLSFEYGKGQWLKKGKDGAVVTYGNMTHKALLAAQELENDGISIGVLNIPTPLDFDKKAILDAVKTGFIITYEDHNVKTGIGGEIAKIILESQKKCKLLNLGVSGYGLSASPDKLYEIQKIDTKNLVEQIKEKL